MDEKELATTLKQLRKKNNLTQKDVADYLDITPQAYQRYESLTKTNQPPIANLRKLSVLFKVNASMLIGEESTAEENKDFFHQADVLMFKDKEGWDKLSYEEQQRIMKELSDLADFYIAKENKNK